MKREPVRNIVVASLAVSMAAVIRFGLEPWLQGQSPLLIFTIPVAVCALYASWKTALYATFLSLAAGTILFIEPIGAVKVVNAPDRVRIVLFASIGCVISFLGWHLQRSRSELIASEKRYKLIVKSMRDAAIFYLTPEGCVQSWNLGAEQIKGYRADEVIGKHMSAFYTEEDRKIGLPQALLDQARRDGFAHVKGWRMRKNDSRFWAEVTITALYDEDAKLYGYAKLTRDRTVEKELITSLEESEQTSRALLESLTQAVIGIGHDGAIRLVNRATETIFGYLPNELIGKPIELLLPEVSRERHVRERNRFFDNPQPRPMGQGMELKGRHKNGTVFPIEASLSLTETPSGPLGVSFVTDITRRKSIEADLLKERSQLKSILDNSPVLVSIRDLQGRFVVANKSFCSTFGMSEGEVIGKFTQQIFAAELVDEIRELDMATLRSDGTTQREESVPVKSGGFRTYLTIRFPVSYLDTAEPFGICSFSIDITEQKSAEEKALFAARHDQLTNLPNRGLVYDIGAHLIETSKRKQSRVAVLFFDLDRFKPINDTYGHRVGDAVLRQVADRLRASVRSSDVIGRIGGDEFVAILFDVQSNDAAAHAASHLLSTLSRPYQVEELALRTSPSIGISIFPDDGEDIGFLIRRADAAMYHAKANGRNTFQFFTPEINQNTERAFALEQRLRQSLGKDDFEIFYQPVVNTTTLQVVAAEALIRWRQKDNEYILPGEFIAAAETSGLINQLGHWVLVHVCEQIATWHRQGLDSITIAVNVSPIQFRSRDFFDQVQSAIRHAEISPRFLELEVTETTVMTQAAAADLTLAALKSLGLRISLDDFGTGYSSLSYLSHLPIDKLKIDQSFIRSIDTDERSLAIAETVITLAKKLQMEVVAEGIETESALGLLVAKQCELGQGYLISKPLPAAAFFKWCQGKDAQGMLH